MLHRRQGVDDALKVIGGYVPGTLVHAARAMEMSHIFFGQIEHHLWQVFATHPPLRKRIRRIDPNWDGQYIERKPTVYEQQEPGLHNAEVGVGRAALVAAAMAGALAENGADLDTCQQAANRVISSIRSIGR